MTPEEQDKELRIEIARKVYPKPTPSEIMIWGTPEAVIDEVYSEAPIVYEFARYITADRKRVALEARLNEVQSAYEHWINGRKFISSYFRDRIAELSSNKEGADNE